MLPARAPTRRANEAGYAMVTLLIAIGLMSVFMSAALPAWRHAAQREKEAELLWRGRQYDRAIQLYRQKYSTPGPPSLDILIEEKFLRKKYKDPITNGEFDLRPVSPMGTTQDEPGQTDQATRRPRRRATARGDREEGQIRRGQLIGGVRSRSKARSIMVLNGRQHYNEWDFTYVPYQDRLSKPEEQVAPGRPGRQPTRGGGRSQTQPSRTRQPARSGVRGGP
jgi:type II secretory pathway pseudopilin PulG